MGCNLTYDKNGRLVMAICGSGVKADPCHVCGKPHAKLCDFPLGGEKAGQTCDRKLCGRHANAFDPNRLPESIKSRLRHEYDTFDLCAAHLRHVNSQIGKEQQCNSTEKK